MPEIPLFNGTVSAIAMTMYDLGMLIATTKPMPSHPEPIPGREVECDLAALGMPLVNVDEAISSYVTAYHHRLA